MVQTNLAIMYDHVCMYFECSSFTIIIQFLHKFGFIRQIAIGIRDNLPTNTVAVKHTDPCHIQCKIGCSKNIQPSSYWGSPNLGKPQSWL